MEGFFRTETSTVVYLIIFHMNIPLLSYYLPSIVLHAVGYLVYLDDFFPFTKKKSLVPLANHSL